MKFLTAPLAFALAVALSGTALAMPDISPPPPETTASVQQVNLSAPDQQTTSIAKPLLKGPDQRTGPTADLQPQPVAAQAPSVPAVPSDGGLSTFLIVLISVGGALALCGIAYTRNRVVHRHGHAAG